MENVDIVSELPFRTERTWRTVHFRCSSFYVCVELASGKAPLCF